MFVCVSYRCTGPSAHSFPLLSGDDALNIHDVLTVDDPVMIAHFESLAYDVSFRSWE